MTASDIQSDTITECDHGTPHAEPVECVLKRLGSEPGGLTPAEAEGRLRRIGRNALPQAQGKSAFVRFMGQLDNLLIYVLMASAAVTALLGHPIDTAVILGVIVLNALIGMVQEGKAEAALEAIRHMISPKASVMRGGARLLIDAAFIVPGDILILEAGDRIAADVRLVKARNLRIDEAVLTGESVPVDKDIAPVAADAALGDRRAMAYSGTLVAAGQGLGVVTATGLQTELGRISTLIGKVAPLETPLIRQMNGLARQLTIVILLLSALTLAFAIAVRGYAPADAFMAVVGMAVAAIPEGLPAVMTITLAIGVERMAGLNAIIRRLPAVETLGAVSIICSDKTGTLTRNEMMATDIVTAAGRYAISGTGYAPVGALSPADGNPISAHDPARDGVALVALLCSDADVRREGGEWIMTGDPMEGALIALGMKLGAERQDLTARLPRLDEIPFDAAHRYMVTLHRRGDGATLACVKGAPERLVEMCATAREIGGPSPIDRGRWIAEVERLAANGRRVIALASAVLDDGKDALAMGDVDGRLVLEGLVGLIDPARPEAVSAIAECRSAGIAVKMITGDHAATATAIAATLGLADPHRFLTGRDLDKLSGDELAAAAAATSVFARTSPEHKLRLVEALQRGGAVVAMTGDGVNDAPALKRADVGVAMGRNGTEAAKEASSMVLADDNFASIVAAVREGRTVYDNLTKVIAWTLPTSFGQMLIVIAAILLGIALPLTPVQILWINMVTVVMLGLVLAFEPAEPGVMARPPRPQGSPILSRFLIWRVAAVSVLYAVFAFALYAWAAARGLSPEAARTIVVDAIVVMGIFYLFSVRYLYGGALTWTGILGTRPVLIGVGGLAVLQLAFTFLPPMQALFGTRAIGLQECAAVLAAGVALFLVFEAEKAIVRQLGGRD